MNWFVKRIGQSVLTVFAVLTLSFGLVRLMPGNVIDAMIVEMERQGVPPAQAEQRVQQMIGIDANDPLHVAYADYMGDMLQGDLGISIYYGEPVAQLLAEAAPWSIFLLSWATFIGFLVGVILGALMAYYEGGKLDLGLTSYAMVMGSVPYYVFAVLLLLFLAYRAQMFPISGRAPSRVDPGFNWPYIAGVINHAALPVLSLVLSGSIASLSMRGNSIRVLGEDYIRVARLRGLKDSTIAVQYVARNAILPMYTGFVIAIGTMFGGAVILETVFSYYGMGYLMVEAVNRRDYTLMMGCFMVITIAVVIALMFADLTYNKIDPRTGGENREAY